MLFEMLFYISQDFLLLSQPLQGMPCLSSQSVNAAMAKIIAAIKLVSLSGDKRNNMRTGAVRMRRREIALGRFHALCFCIVLKRSLFSKLKLTMASLHALIFFQMLKYLSNIFLSFFKWRDTVILQDCILAGIVRCNYQS